MKKECNHWEKVTQLRNVRQVALDFDIQTQTERQIFIIAKIQRRAIVAFQNKNIFYMQGNQIST